MDLEEYIIYTITNNADIISGINLDGTMFNVMGVVPENVKDKDETIVILADEEETPLTLRDLLSHSIVRFCALKEI